MSSIETETDNNVDEVDALSEELEEMKLASVLTEESRKLYTSAMCQLKWNLRKSHKGRETDQVDLSIKVQSILAEMMQLQSKYQQPYCLILKYYKSEFLMQTIISCLNCIPELKILLIDSCSLDQKLLGSLVESMKQLTNLQELLIHNRSVPPGFLQYLSTAIQCMPRLETLDLQRNDISTLSDMEGLASCLKYTPNLQRLNLRKNQIGGECLKYLVECVKHVPHLKRLCLDDNQITEEHSQYLSQVLISVPELTYLTLTCNPLRSKGIESLADALPHLPQLKHLNLASVSLNAWPRFCESLGKLSQLEYLNLSFNSLSYQDCSHFADSLVFLSHLKELHMHRCNLGNYFAFSKNDQVTCLCQGLKRVPSLEHLNLSHNHLYTKLSMESLADALNYLPKLQQLCLNSNNLQGTEFEPFDKLISSPLPLKKLELFDNLIGLEGCVHLSKIFLLFPSLEILQLSHNRIGSHGGLLAICKMWSNTPLLKYLGLSHNAINDEDAKHIAQYLDKLPNLRTLHLLNPSMSTNACALFNQSPVVRLSYRLV